LIVVDASPLIALAKTGRLDLLREVHKHVLLTPAVKTEVVDRGKEIGAPGVEHVERAMQDGWLRTAQLSRREQSFTGRVLATSQLHRGEAEAIAVARLRGLLVMLDDKEARTHAELLDLEYVGTAGFLLEAFLRRHLGLAELEEAVADLTRVMWLSPAVVTEILRRAREART
jgi:predicted nucleic acid-binding protein